MKLILKNAFLTEFRILFYFKLYSCLTCIVAFNPSVGSHFALGPVTKSEVKLKSIKEKTLEGILRMSYNGNIDNH